MTEIFGFRFILPLPPPPNQLMREAQICMDGFEPMTGRVNMDITYLVLDSECIEYKTNQIIAEMTGIVFEDEPAADRIHSHVLAEGYVNPSVVIDVWQDGIE